MGGIEHTVHTVVGERIGVAGTVCSPVHAADVTVVITASVIVETFIRKSRIANQSIPVIVILDVYYLIV